MESQMKTTNLEHETDGLIGRITNDAGSRVLVESLHGVPQIDLKMITVVLGV